MTVRQCARWWGIGVILTCATGASAGTTFDWGDAPDDDNVCEFATLVAGASYPTQAGTSNALAGRTAPFHDPSAVTPGTNVYFAGPPTVEDPAFEAECDWVTGISDNICDYDDAPFMLCLNGACNTGVYFVGSDPDCGELGAEPFGFAPTGIGYYVYEVTREPSSTQPAYVNVAVDVDLDASWGDAGEWVEVDRSITAPGWPTQVLVTPPFPVTTVFPCTVNALGWCIGPFWTRFLVSTEAIASSLPPATVWDGSGQAGGYAAGETEDVVPETDPGTTPLPPPETWLHFADGAISFTLDAGNSDCNPPLTTVALSSPAIAPLEVRRYGPVPYTTGDTLPIEIVALSLTGSDPGLGPITVHNTPGQHSLGLLRNVQADGGGGLISAESFFDVFVEIELSGPPGKLHTAAPAHLYGGTASTFPAETIHVLLLPLGQRGLPLRNDLQQVAGYLCAGQLVRTGDAEQPDRKTFETGKLDEFDGAFNGS